MPQPAAPEVKSSATPLTDVSKSWKFISANKPEAYFSQADVTLAFTSDSGAVRDTLTQQMTFTLLNGSSSGSTSFLGSITGLTTETGSRIGRLETLPTFPISFTGHITAGILILDELEGKTYGKTIDCSSPAFSAFSGIERNLFALPEQLHPGMTWTENLSSVRCTGTTPLITTTTYSYRVVGEAIFNGRDAVEIERAEKSSLAGEGSQDQHRLLIRGEASGTSKIHLDRNTGALLDSQGKQTMNLLITAGRMQHVTQIVHSRTTRQQ